MSSAYGKMSGPVGERKAFLEAHHFDPDLSITHVAREGTNLIASNTVLVEWLRDEFNEILDEGKTYPFEDAMSTEAYLAYFFSHDVFMFVKSATLEQVIASNDLAFLKEHVVGLFYIKPNFPGRSNHICNGGFVTLKGFRGKGLAKYMAQTYLEAAPQLGYKTSLFNLVYSTNLASVALWEKYGFTRLATVPNGARLKGDDGKDVYVDSYMYLKEF